MKKLVIMFAAIAAISFASCGNQTPKSNAATDSDTVVADTLDSIHVCDSVVADSVCLD